MPSSKARDGLVEKKKRIKTDKGTSTDASTDATCMVDRPRTRAPFGRRLFDLKCFSGPRFTPGGRRAHSKHQHARAFRSFFSFLFVHQVVVCRPFFAPPFPLQRASEKWVRWPFLAASPGRRAADGRGRWFAPLCSYIEIFFSP